MKITAIIVIGLLTYSGSNRVLGQSYNGGQASVTSNAAPKNFIHMFMGRATTFAVFAWDESNGAVSYIIRIYRSGGTLYKIVPNVIGTVYNVTNLESSHNYSATVSAVYKIGLGQRQASRESNPVYFETDDDCSEGGRMYLRCTAHCVGTCDDPVPVCSKICQEGCGCGGTTPIWHNGKCIPLAQCPSRNRPIKPKNAKALSTGRTSALVLWDTAENIEGYLVKMRLANSEEVLQTFEVAANEPIISVSQLTPGVTYEFVVSLVPIVPVTNTLSPPSNVRVTDITNNGFTVHWTAVGYVKKFAVLLYDENQIPIFSNNEVVQNSIEIEGLASGSTYYVSVSRSRLPGRYGRFSSPLAATTTGKPQKQEKFQSTIVSYTPPSPSTSVSTTASPKITRCRQVYESVKKFYQRYPKAQGGPTYPNCDSQGMFVTKTCTSNPRSCWCIKRTDGKKVFGSDFGYDNSHFELNCNQFGNLRIQPLQMQVRNLTRTSLELRWNAVDGVKGYVIVVNDLTFSVRTIAVEGAKSTTYQLENLQPGQLYEISIYAVDEQGWTSPMTQVDISTSLLDTPQDLSVTKLSSNSVRLLWKFNPHAHGYAVSLRSSETNQVTRSFKTTLASVVITNLLPQAYSIEVREVTCDAACDNINASVVHSSNPASVEISLMCKIPKLDLIYVFDISSNNDLGKLKKLAEDITHLVPELDSESGTRIAGVTSNQVQRVAFSFSRFNNANDVVDEIQSLTSDTQQTAHLEDALTYVLRNFFNPRRNAAYRPRSTSVSTVIVFTQGEVTSTSSLLQAAALLKSKTKVITVGTSTASGTISTLRNIATTSDKQFTLSSSQNLKQAARLISQQFCTM